MTAQAPYESLPEWTESRLLEVAKARGWYVRASASVPTPDGGERHPFQVTVPSRELCELLAALAANKPAGDDDGVRVATPEEEAEIDRAAGLVKLVLRLPNELHARLDSEAKAYGCVLPAFIRHLLGESTDTRHARHHEGRAMTSPTQRAGADVRRWALNFSPYRVARMIEHALGQFVSYDDYAALQARIAELEARNAASERDAGRLAWLAANAEIRWPSQTGGYNVYWSDTEYLGDPLADRIDAAIDAHAQGQK